MKVLITGASGLLGSDVVKAVEAAGWKAVKVCNKARTGFIDLDLTTDEAMDKISALDWDCVVHTAAWRVPEQCENNQDETYKINVDVSDTLAEIADGRGAKMIYISTDYIFDGSRPPYSEDAEPNPINYYGKSKLMGEEKVLEMSSNNASLRVPILYGISAGLSASTLLSSSIEAVKSANKVTIENKTVRYPTYTGDVAQAIVLILNEDGRGKFNFSGECKTTKYGVALAVAEAMKMSSDHIIADNDPPSSAVGRPHDAHLSCRRIKELGMGDVVPMRERILLLLEESNGVV